jgi:hypothetical protein
MKYYKVTLFNPGPPIDLGDTTVVYCVAPDPAELLPIALDAHGKPVKEYQEVSKDVYDANK